LINVRLRQLGRRWMILSSISETKVQYQQIRYRYPFAKF